MGLCLLVQCTRAAEPPPRAEGLLGSTSEGDRAPRILSSVIDCELIQIRNAVPHTNLLIFFSYIMNLGGVSTKEVTYLAYILLNTHGICHVNAEIIHACGLPRKQLKAHRRMYLGLELQNSLS